MTIILMAYFHIRISPEATGMLELAAFKDFTASATRDGYTHTAAVVIPVKMQVHNTYSGKAMNINAN